MATFMSYTVFCNCKSENIRSLDDADHGYDSYARYECLDCGKYIWNYASTIISSKFSFIGKI